MIASPAQRIIHSTAEVNGARLYHELRGTGPLVVFVQGTTGDGGSFETVADLLAGEFTVVTYHRRGNSWSPRPAGWSSTSVDEQADDLAALIEALGGGPAAIFGTSDGATILLNLLIRHPEVACGAIVHEPLLEPLIESGGSARRAIDAFSARVESACATGGARAGMEALIRAVASDAVWEARDPTRRDRVADTAATYFEIEAAAFAGWLPDADALARVTVPTLVAAGATDVLGGGFRESCEWVARQLGTTVREFPGAHTPYLDHAGELAAMIRPFLHDAHGHASGDKRPGVRLASPADQDVPIVLVPGGLSGWHSWRPMAERLGRERAVVRTQLRGLELAGSGQPIPDTYAVSTEIDAVLAAVDDLGLHRFDLAGWSLGGRVALDFALMYPGRVRSLTVIEPEAMWLLPQSGFPTEEAAALEARDRSLTGRTISAAHLKDFLVRAGLGDAGSDVEAHPSWPIWMQNRQILAHIGMLWDDDGALDRLRECAIPILAIHGTESQPADIAMTRTLATTAPHGTLLELPGDHACHLQNPDRFLDALRWHASGATQRAPEEAYL
jgi:pimeloyl-ACP methyl ester carboxylesterase